MKRYKFFTTDIIYPICMFILFCLYAYVRIFHDAVIITVISIIAAASISLYYTTKNRKNRDHNRDTIIFINIFVIFIILG